MKFSKSKIDRAGDILKADGLKKSERESHLETLSSWRAFHVKPLNAFAKVLKGRVKQINPKAIVAQRLKRTPSTLLKLRKHRTMRLSTMQDIGGLRAIFENVKEVYALIEIYTTAKTRYELFSLDDYILRPKKDGYRSAHLVYKLKKDPSIFLEIQVRSSLQHIWATAVEVFGTLKNSSFKSGFGDRKWLVFFKYLSSTFAIKEGTPVLKDHQGLSEKEILAMTVKLIEGLQVIPQLNLYTQIYKLIHGDASKRGRRNKYSLIILDSNNSSIKIDSFSANQIEEATASYLMLEKKFFEDSSVNIVLVNTDDLKKLEISYPNYFMDTKKLTFYLAQIVMGRFI